MAISFIRFRYVHISGVYIFLLVCRKLLSVPLVASTYLQYRRETCVEEKKVELETYFGKCSQTEENFLTFLTFNNINTVKFSLRNKKISKLWMLVFKFTDLGESCICNIHVFTHVFMFFFSEGKRKVRHCRQRYFIILYCYFCSCVMDEQMLWNGWRAKIFEDVLSAGTSTPAWKNIHNFVIFNQL